MKYDPKIRNTFSRERHQMGFAAGQFYIMSELGAYCPLCMTYGADAHAGADGQVGRSAEHSVYILRDCMELIGGNTNKIVYAVEIFEWNPGYNYVPMKYNNIEHTSLKFVKRWGKN